MGAVFQELTCSCSCSFFCDLCFIYTKTLENIQNHYDGVMHYHNTLVAPKTVKMCCSICRIREIKIDKFRPHLQSVKHLEAVKKLKGKILLSLKLTWQLKVYCWDVYTVSNHHYVEQCFSTGVLPNYFVSTFTFLSWRMKRFWLQFVKSFPGLFFLISWSASLKRLRSHDLTWFEEVFFLCDKHWGRFVDLFFI